MRKIIPELDRALIAAIMEDQEWELQRDLLHAYQDAGVGAHELGDLLDDLRTQVGNEAGNAAQAGIVDDRILDVLDIVAGWCSPSSRVWPALPVQTSTMPAAARAAQHLLRARVTRYSI